MDAIVAALEALTESELHALLEATYKAPQTAPGLLAWIDAACESELNHRAGREYELQSPEAAIQNQENAITIDCASAMRTSFANEVPAVQEFVDALVNFLTGVSRRQ